MNDIPVVTTLNLICLPYLLYSEQRPALSEARQRRRFLSDLIAITTSAVKSQLSLKRVAARKDMASCSVVADHREWSRAGPREDLQSLQYGN